MQIKNVELFKIIKRVLLFLIIIFILDFSIGSSLEYIYFHQRRGLYARATYGIEKTKADLLIFGSSSANHHYVPSVFKDSLKITVYNEGRDGIDVIYCVSILKGILKRYSPKIVILNLSPNELSPDKGYDRLSTLLPYYRKNPEIKEFIALRSKFEEWKLISRIYPYNSTFLTLLNGLKSGNDKSFKRGGYVPLIGEVNPNFAAEPKLVDDKIDSNRVHALISFIDLCNERNITLFVVISPTYLVEKETKTVQVASDISKQLGISFLNFSNDTTLKKTFYFKDKVHLNNNGAHKFSETVAGLIKNKK